MQRLTERKLQGQCRTFTETYEYHPNLTSSSCTTQLVKKLTFTGGAAKTLEYSYDANANIKTVRNGTSEVASYEYDGLNRLKRENIAGEKTVEYHYDSAGNLTSKEEYAYTTGDLDTPSGTGFVAAFGAALMTSLQSAAISSAIGAGIGLAMGGLTTGSWEGALEGLTSGLIDGFMWGGVFAGGAQILSGAFKGYAQIANRFGKLQNVKKSPLFSPDRLKGAKEIAKIAKKGQAFYDYGGTLIRIGKIHLDVSTKSLLHLAIFGIKHFPVGTIMAGILGGID